MTLVVDGNTVDPPAGVDTVADVFLLVQSDLVQNRRRFLKTVTIDGQIVVQGDGSALWTLPAAGSTSLMIETAVPTDLFSPIVADARQLLTDLGGAQTEFARRTRTTTDSLDVETLLSLLKRWEVAGEALDAMCQAVDTVGPKSSPERLVAAVQAYGDDRDRYFGEIGEALDLEDRILIADSLEFDLTPLAQRLGDLLEQLLRELE
jgi:hypothetical protein